MANKELLLIDGRNWVYRNAYTRTTLFSKKRPTGAIFGCLSSLIRLHRFFPDAAIVFCWDGDDARESWRNKLANSYKGNRVDKKDKPVPIQVTHIRQQIPIITEFVHKFGFRNFAVPKLEADDLIGILATNLKDEYDKVTIYSTDKDFYQLIKGNVAVVRDFDKKENCKEVTIKEIKKRWGVQPKHWLHYRSLVGEKTDNIDKPIAGVGPKKAIAMLKAGVDPSSDTPHEDYKVHWDKIRLCYRLTKIVRKAHDKRLPEISQKEIRIILKSVKGKDLHRLPSSRSQKVKRYMMDFLVEYELNDIIERRQQLWQIK